MFTILQPPFVFRSSNMVLGNDWFWWELLFHRSKFWRELLCTEVLFVILNIILLFVVEYLANELALKWGWLWSSASVLSLDFLLSDSVMEELKPLWGKPMPSLIFVKWCSGLGDFKLAPLEGNSSVLTCIVCELKLTGRRKDSLPEAPRPSVAISFGNTSE